MSGPICSTQPRIDSAQIRAEHVPQLRSRLARIWNHQYSTDLNHSSDFFRPSLICGFHRIQDRSDHRDIRFPLRNEKSHDICHDEMRQDLAIVVSQTFLQNRQEFTVGVNQSADCRDRNGAHEPRPKTPLSSSAKLRATSRSGCGASGFLRNQLSRPLRVSCPLMEWNFPAVSTPVLSSFWMASIVVPSPTRPGLVVPLWRLSTRF